MPRPYTPLQLTQHAHASTSWPDAGNNPWGDRFSADTHLTPKNATRVVGAFAMKLPVDKTARKRTQSSQAAYSTSRQPVAW